MQILFAGDNREFLAAFAQNLQGVEAIILATGDLEATAQRFAVLKEEIHFILIDVNHLQQNFRAGVTYFRTHYPEADLWALFDGNSPPILRALTEMGFSRLISYRDNLPELIQEAHARRTYDSSVDRKS